MAQHHKLVCGSLFVFFAATHAGCAGSGLKNIFTRNETDGYHSLDELESEELPVAATEESEEEVEKPSIAARLASWRPFGKPEPEKTEEEPFATSDASAAPADAAVAGRSSRFLGRPLSKRDSVEPDPFLNDAQRPVGLGDSPGFNARNDKKTATTDETSKTADGEFGIAADTKPKREKSAVAVTNKVQEQAESPDPDARAVALGATRKSDATDSGNEDDDNALAKRFEQHFLLNSVGTVQKTGTDAVATGKELRQKAASKAEAKKREVSGIADRQISEFDYLLTADQDRDGTNSGFRRNAEVNPLQNSKRTTATAEKPENSLSSFDRLMGTEGSGASQNETAAASKATRSSKKKASALDINVADAEALFGAAAARQNTQLKQTEIAPRAASSDRSADFQSVWSQSSEKVAGSGKDAATSIRPGSLSNHARGDVAGAFARSLDSNSGSGKIRTDNAAPGAPAASAGNVDGDDDSAGWNTEIRLSNASGSSGDRRIVTADYGTAHSGVVIHPAAMEGAVSDDLQFTAAPVAPASPQDSISEAGSAATRPGLVQSFSARNWLLLIGGIIVIALLFAPGRIKPLNVNGRPANG